MEAFFHNKNFVVDKVLRKRPLGNVYKARRVSDGVLCAIKELDVRHMSEEEREDAMEEIRVLATVRNENVISYYDAFAGDNMLYVVMEYCDEPDLGRHIKTRAENQKFYSEAQVWSYLVQMLRGLVAVHSRGLIHRDVRSGNILQLDSSAVKIGDIRVGKVLKEGPAATYIGNPHCVPPEVWQSRAYTFKSDVWAVGCVLYEMITLAIPFGGCSLPDLRAKIIEGQYQAIPTSFSNGLSTVIKLLLNPDQATRISARDMLMHPVLQAHLHHAPAPAPMLRVRATREKNKFGAIPVQSPISVEQKSSYPTLVVPGGKQQVHVQAPDSRKGTTDPPENRQRSVPSSGKPTAPPGRSRVAPILAPRAILSSRDNDEMLANLNQPSNQASRVNLPRVAMLSKVIPKPTLENSTAPPLQSVPSTPRVNMKHFKTAYIQSPKVDSSEFVTSFPDDRSDISRKEKLENVFGGSGTLKSKSATPAPKVVTPRKEKSTESLRSAGSSRSDDSSTRIRAPSVTLDPSHTEFPTPRRENSFESARSGASSRSGDLGINVRAPVDLSDVPEANGITHTVDSFRSMTSATSSQSNGSATSVRATVTELDPAQPLPLSNDLQTSLAGDDTLMHQTPELVCQLDGPEPSQRIDDLTGNEPLPSQSLRVETLDSSTQASKASRTKPVNSQTKVTTPSRTTRGALDGVAKKTLTTSASVGKAAGAALDKRVPNLRNRRLSFDGLRNERPLASDPSKVAAPKRESISGMWKSPGGAIKKPADSVSLSRSQGSGVNPSSITRQSTGPPQILSDGAKKKSQNGVMSGVLPRRPSTTPGKGLKDLEGNSVGSPKPAVFTVFQPGMKNSEPSPAGPPANKAKQGANPAKGGSNTGLAPAQSPQKPLRSRRLSLDFPIKGNGAQPITGAAR